MRAFFRRLCPCLRLAISVIFRCMGNSNIKIDISADTTGLGAGVAQAQAELDKLGRSSGKLASEYGMLNTASKATQESTLRSSTEFKNLDNQLSQLLSRIDPTYRGMRQLDSGSELLHQGLKSGLLTQTQYHSSLGLLEQQFGKVVKETENTVEVTARAKQEFLVLGRELASGNMSRVPGTLSIIAQGLSGPVLTGLGAVAVAVAAGAIVWESYGGNIQKVREELDRLDGDLALKTMAQLNKRFEEYAALAQAKRAEASAGGFGWIKDAKEAALYEEEMRKVGLQIDANKRFEEKQGNAGGQASKLAAESPAAKRREMEQQIALLQIYHDKQKAGSLAEIDSLSKIEELQKRLAKVDKPGRVGKADPNATAVAGMEAEMFRREMAAMGVAAEQVKVYELTMQGADDKQIKRAQAAADRIGAINQEAQATKDHAKAVEEANKIIFDIDPIAKASHEWEKLVALKEQGLLTDEQMGKAYAKTFEKIDKAGNDAFASLENAVRGWGTQFTDEMVKMARTGKINFSSLADSIINDLLRIQIQKNVTDNLVKAGTGFLDNIFGGIFGGGNSENVNVGNGSVGNVMDTSGVMVGGRYSAAGGFDIPSGVNPLTQLHQKEMVLPAEYADVIRGISRGGSSSSNAAPNVIIQVTNNGQPVTAKQQGGPQFDGRDWILGVVLEAADSNPHFRNAMGMAR